MKKLIIASLLGGLLIVLFTSFQPYTIPSIHKIKSQEQFNDYVLAVKKNLKNNRYAFDFFSKNAVVETAQEDGALEHTTTNNQISTIDEADVLKTNGKMTYYLDNNRLIIVNSDPTSQVGLQTILDLSSNDNVYYNSLLLMNNKLILIGEQYNHWYGFERSYDNGSSNDDSTDSIEPSYDRMDPYWNYTTMTYIRIIDLNKPISLDFSQSLDIEGQLLAARLKEDNLYFVTQKSNYHLLERSENIKADDVLPHRVYNQKVLDNDVSEISILVPDSLDVMTLTKLNVDNETITSSSYMGNATQVLLTENALLVASAHYEDWNNPTTSLLRFDLDNDLALLANTEVKGYLLSSYAMDYYDGHVRIAITQQNKETTDNAIFVYDVMLNQVGKLDHLAYDETIYSVLFKQEKAYVVTFKQIDPFFVIDLSNPKNPKVAGELKIPGYSSYLHQINKDSVVGFGKDVKFDQGFLTQGAFKVSLFDVSNPASPIEKDVLFAGSTYSSSDVMFNPRALMYEPKRSLIGFVLHDSVMTFTTKENTEYKYEYNQNYILMQINQENIDVIINEPSNQNQYFIRSIVVEDSLFIFTNESFIVYNLNTLSKKEINY